MSRCKLRGCGGFGGPSLGFGTLAFFIDEPLRHQLRLPFGGFAVGLLLNGPFVGCRRGIRRDFGRQSLGFEGGALAFLIGQRLRNETGFPFGGFAVGFGLRRQRGGFRDLRVLRQRDVDALRGRQMDFVDGVGGVELRSASRARRNRIAAPQRRVGRLRSAPALTPPRCRLAATAHQQQCK